MFYLELFRALQEHEVRYLVVGGVAVNLHGIGRLTVDVDLMLALDALNLERFVTVALRFPLEPVMPVKLEHLADAAKVNEWIAKKGMLAFALRSSDPATPTVDILVKPVVPFEDAWARRVQRSVEGIAIPIATIEDIIRLKTGTGRQKDEADIQALRQLLRMEPARYAS
ncbi:MAG: hypothetical protein ACREGK_03065 [Geminicoccales bacterium]